MAVGCTYIKPEDKHAVHERFKFLRDAHTTRSEIHNRLGEPASLYENGRIITYILREYHDGQLRLDNWEHLGSPAVLRNPTYHLVLVFGADGVLERHSLVRVR